MSSLPPPQRIANADTVLNGPHGEVSRRAKDLGLSRQSLYRDAAHILHALEQLDNPTQLQQLREQLDTFRHDLHQLTAQLEHAVVIDDDCLAHFASTSQSEGVSLPVAQRLLVPLLAKPCAGNSNTRKRLPSLAQLGRWSRDAALRSAPLLGVLDEFSRSRVEQGAPDEIFFGKKPCLMVVEQQSLCWVSGRLADRRSGDEWAKE